MDKDEVLRAVCKGLVWESGWFCDQDAFYSAHPSEGWSVVQFSSRNGRWAVDDPFGNASDDDWATASEAQAAAEADYRARIAEAINLDLIMALVEALQVTRDKLHSHIHDQYDGVWNEADFAEETAEADAARAAFRAAGGEVG